MADNSRLGPWGRGFPPEHLIKERNLSRGTQQSYRDTPTLLIPFVAWKVRRNVDAMKVIHVSADLVRMFLLSSGGGSGLRHFDTEPAPGSLHSLFRFVALHCPEHLAWCEEICLLPFKKCTQAPDEDSWIETRSAYIELCIAYLARTTY